MYKVYVQKLKEYEEWLEKQKQKIDQKFLGLKSNSGAKHQKSVQTS